MIEPNFVIEIRLTQPGGGQTGAAEMFSQILALLQENKMAVENITKEVEDLETVSAGVVTTMARLADEVRAVAGDRAATEALAARIDAVTGSLDAAVRANTPAASETPADPSPAPAGNDGASTTEQPADGSAASPADPSEGEQTGDGSPADGGTPLTA